MPPSLAIALAGWAKEPVDALLGASDGDCAPETAIKAALELHKGAVARTPAYRAFLCEAQSAPADASAVHPCHHWGDVPYTSKEDYVQRWPLEEVGSCLSPGDAPPPGLHRPPACRRRGARAAAWQRRILCTAPAEAAGSPSCGPATSSTSWRSVHGAAPVPVPPLPLLPRSAHLRGPACSLPQ